MLNFQMPCLMQRALAEKRVRAHTPASITGNASGLHVATGAPTHYVSAPQMLHP